MNYLRDWQRENRVPAAEVYDLPLFVLAGSLVIGFVCNLLIAPTSARLFEKAAELEIAAPVAATGNVRGGLTWGVVVAWSAVSVPLLWGLYNTLTTARVFFD